MPATAIPRLLSLTLVLLALVTARVTAQVESDPVDGGHAVARLVSGPYYAGQPILIGLHLAMDSGWHVNWLNPGDAGLPPTISWTLPDGFVASDIDWPYPERLPLPPLMGFGYEQEILLPVTITAPPGHAGNAPLDISAEADWLVCREECVPERATLTLTIPPTSETETNTITHPAFRSIRERDPIAAGKVEGRYRFDDTTITLRVIGIAHSEAIASSGFFFPNEKGVIENAEAQRITPTTDGLEITIRRNLQVRFIPDTIKGVLVASGALLPNDDRHAIEIVAQAETNTIGATTSESGTVLWVALFSAFLGGIILNLMPCVLPVLSLKVLGVVHSARENREAVIRHGLIFTLGVLVSFWLLAGLLLFFRAGGEQLGWGFQLQSPAFVIGITFALFLFGLNQLGVFEIGASLTGLGGVASSAGGNTAAFLNGVLATFVATPCTAPFMGSALGFSLSQPPLVAMLIFTALGLGMAFPYLLISFVPSLGRILPKPGAWMETLKHVMGFLLLATVIWLIWVLAEQTDPLTVAWVLLGLLLLAMSAWILGRWGIVSARPRTRLAARISALVCIGAALALSFTAVRTDYEPRVAGSTGSGDELAWMPYSDTELARLRSAGTPVFVNFTAAWCLSCKVNERIALDNDRVIAEFDRRGIATLKGDWTRRDAGIAATLARYGRNSVPLYLLFDRRSNEPLVLPEVLTPDIVLDALASMKENARAENETDVFSQRN